MLKVQSFSEKVSSKMARTALSESEMSLIEDEILEVPVQLRVRKKEHSNIKGVTGYVKKPEVFNDMSLDFLK